MIQSRSLAIKIGKRNKEVISPKSSNLLLILIKYNYKMICKVLQYTSLFLLPRSLLLDHREGVMGRRRQVSSDWSVEHVTTILTSDWSGPWPSRRRSRGSRAAPWPAPWTRSGRWWRCRWSWWSCSRCAGSPTTHTSSSYTSCQVRRYTQHKDLHILFRPFSVFFSIYLFLFSFALVPLKI